MHVDLLPICAVAQTSIHVAADIFILCIYSSIELQRPASHFVLTYVILAAI